MGSVIQFIFIWQMHVPEASTKVWVLAILLHICHFQLILFNGGVELRLKLLGQYWQWVCFFEASLCHPSPLVWGEGHAVAKVLLWCTGLAGRLIAVCVRGDLYSSSIDFHAVHLWACHRPQRSWELVPSPIRMSAIKTRAIDGGPLLYQRASGLSWDGNVNVQF